MPEQCTVCHHPQLEYDFRALIRSQHLVVLLVVAICVYAFVEPFPKVVPRLANLRSPTLSAHNVTLQQSTGTYVTETRAKRRSSVSTLSPSKGLRRAKLTSVEHVFYNRVPKCGSSATRDILMTLAKKNGFNLKLSSTYDALAIRQSEQVGATIHIICVFL